jgi:predicted XRE-type DNA-binding protein
MPGHTPWREIRAERPPNPATTEAQGKLGIKLALLREQSGLTKAELAERLGMTQPSISHSRTPMS